MPREMLRSFPATSRLQPQSAPGISQASPGSIPRKTPFYPDRFPKASRRRPFYAPAIPSNVSLGLPFAKAFAKTPAQIPVQGRAGSQRWRADLSRRCSLLRGHSQGYAPTPHAPRSRRPGAKRRKPLRPCRLRQRARGQTERRLPVSLSSLRHVNRLTYRNAVT